MKVLVVDDETLARQRLQAMIEEMGPPYEIAGEAASGQEALAECQRQDVDIVLLDIRMPGMDGMEAARRLAESKEPPAVIFTTAYDEHALEAFERNALDYLLKPIRRDRLQRALEKAQSLTRPQLQTLAKSQSNTEQQRRQLCASYRGGMQTVPIEQVIYLLAEQKYVTVRHQGGQLLVEESLKSLESDFADVFLRIHRNALVAKASLEGIDKLPDGRRMARLRNLADRLEISRRHLPQIRRWLREGV